MSKHGAITWFEVGTDDPESTHRFYGKMFGWTFVPDPGAGAVPYEIVTTGEGHPQQGGVLHTGGEIPNHAVFYVQVDDVPAALRKAEQLGGKVLVPTQTAGDGLVFAHLIDPQGNHIGVYVPPASAEA